MTLSLSLADIKNTAGALRYIDRAMFALRPILAAATVRFCLAGEHLAE